MVQINFAQKTVNVKIVYYGPGMSGKTTNLEVVHQRAPDHNRGELTSISTDGDRTLFFDYMPLDLGTVAGMRTCFQLYTVPGQVYYNSTRKLVLQGVDGVIFIADSSAAMLDQNIEALRNLEENLNEYGKSMATLPHVIQWNKRDLPDAMPVDECNRLMNSNGAPNFEAIANTGQGVFPTLKALASSVLKNIMQESGAGKSFGNPSAAPQPAPSAATPQPSPEVPAQPASAAAPAFPAPQPGPDVGQPMPGGPQPVRQPAAPMEQPVAVARDTQAAGSPAGLMQQRTPAAKTRPRARTRVQGVGRGTAARRARQQAAASAAQPAPPSKKRGPGKLILFVVLAAGVGAGLSWAALKYLSQSQ